MISLDGPNEVRFGILHCLFVYCECCLICYLFVIGMVRDQAAEAPPPGQKGEQKLVEASVLLYHMITSEPMIDVSQLSEAEQEEVNSFKYVVADHLQEDESDMSVSDSRPNVDEDQGNQNDGSHIVSKKSTLKKSAKRSILDNEEETSDEDWANDRKQALHASSQQDKKKKQKTSKVTAALTTKESNAVDDSNKCSNNQNATGAIQELEILGWKNIKSSSTAKKVIVKNVKKSQALKTNVKTPQRKGNSTSLLEASNLKCPPEIVGKMKSPQEIVCNLKSPSEMKDQMKTGAQEEHVKTGKKRGRKRKVAKASQLKGGYVRKPPLHNNDGFLKDNK